jgi:pimeloyl-ACP methyl ester carboxylesterase
MDLATLENLSFTAESVNLVASAAGPAHGPPMLFLHGSGQTRHSWRNAMLEAARRGLRAIAFDLRGHGDSDWSPDGVYTTDVLIADTKRVIERIGGEPILVGASTGATLSMAIAALPPPQVRAVILIDVSPRPAMDGVAEVRAFMDSAKDGFASLDEAAVAVAAYLPQRARSKDNSGLSRNLRFRDGRYHWHWDPKFFMQMAGEPAHVARSVALLRSAARTLNVPTLLVRGAKSRVVSEEGAREFLAMVPHAEYADVAGADHMVAGDANDAFNHAVFSFLERKGLLAQL